MNFLRVGLAALAAWAVYLALGFLIHAVMLADMWAALQRDKKVVGGEIRLVLLELPGRPGVTSEIEPARVREALDALIA